MSPNAPIAELVLYTPEHERLDAIASWFEPIWARFVLATTHG
jgi:hypothetical protein